MYYICVHAHNDGSTVGLLLWKIRQVFTENPREYRLYIVDDGSTDDTAQVLKRYEGALTATIMRNDEPQGYAACMDQMLRKALNASDRPRRDCAITMSGDFAISPGVIPELVRRFESGADLVIGEAPDVAKSMAGRLVRRVSNRLLRPGLEIPGVHDLLSGVCAIRLVTLKRALPTSEEPFLLTSGECASAELVGRIAAEARQIAVVDVPPEQIRPGAKNTRGALSLAVELFHAGRTLDIPVPEAEAQRLS